MIVSVSQLNRYVSFKLKEDENLRNLMVKGEISNFNRNYQSGHCYFTLKDGESTVKAVMFNSSAHKLEFRPENGMSVIVSCTASVYERDGVYQLYVTDIQPDGAGAHYLAFEQLKKKLFDEGLFDTEHKLELKKFPEKIGVVTSNTGAAVHDIMNVLSRRYPIGSLFIIPAQVQGEGAPESIIKGIKKAGEIGCDLLIIARGGGSAEDLNAFNSEKLGRAVYECGIPTISAVGHETDFTICDFIADLRAPTPSAAAELATEPIDELYNALFCMTEKVKSAVNDFIDTNSQKLNLLEDRLKRLSPEQRLAASEQKLSEIKQKLFFLYEKSISKRENILREKAAVLESLNPLSVLSRGYSLAYKGNKLLSSADETEKDDKLYIRLNKGIIYATVDFTEN